MAQCTVPAVLNNLVFDRIDQDTRTKAWPCLLPPGGEHDEWTAFVISKGGTVDRQLPDRKELRLFSAFSISDKKIFHVERTLIEHKL